MSNIVSRVSRAVIGNYQILKVIGSGSMSTVYQAQDPFTGALVAVKVISGTVVNHPVLRMRFAKECQVARRLDHPHLVRVLDFGLDGNKPYLVMEHVSGGSLGDRLKKQGRLAEDEAVAIITQTASALQWAHERRLVHRDVKPDNILLDEEGRAKLTDLGLVKNLDEESCLTKPLDYLGTPNFTAPEQFMDPRKADALCDLYSLAATLYMALTGQVPFLGPNDFAIGTIMKKKLAEDIVPPRVLVPELSERVNQAILRALKVDRGQRQASVQEFIDSLRDPNPKRQIAEPPAPPAAAARVAGEERRVARRFASRRATSCDSLQEPSSKAWVGKVLDVSETCLCLQISRRFERGAMLSVMLKVRPAEHCVIACVVWVRQVGPRAWKVGCRLAQPLSEADILTLC
jgi:serine/threonine protein kinase